MKWLKITAISAVTVLLIVFVYANIRYISPAMSQEPVSLGFYHLEGIAADDLASQVEKLPGVSACSVNKQSGSIGVTYRYNEISEAALLSSLSSLAGESVYPQDFTTANSGQCPFSICKAWWEQIMLTLRVV